MNFNYIYGWKTKKKIPRNERERTTKEKREEHLRWVNT